MCGLWSYESFLEYSEVFPKIADLLNASGVVARVKDNADKTGLLVEIALPDRTAILNDGERDNWSMDSGGEVIELDIPVQVRNAESIAAEVLKIVGK